MGSYASAGGLIPNAPLPFLPGGGRVSSTELRGPFVQKRIRSRISLWTPCFLPAMGSSGRLPGVTGHPSSELPRVRSTLRAPLLRASEFLSQNLRVRGGQAVP